MPNFQFPTPNMTRPFACAVVLFGLLACTAPGVHAAQGRPGRQAVPPPAQGADTPDAPSLSNGEVVNMLDAYAVVQAQDTLQLNDSQYGPFVTRLRKLQETRRRNQQARNRIIQELRQLAPARGNASPDENAIREKLKALREHDDRAAAEMRKAYDALDEVMDVRQQARFRVFEERIERQKLDLLIRARQAARRGAGGGKP